MTDLPPEMLDDSPTDGGAAGGAGRTNGGGQPALRLVAPEDVPPEPRLTLNRNGNPHKTVANVIDMLSEHVQWRGVLVWDDFAQTVRKTRPAPVREEDTAGVAGEWRDADTTRTQAWLQTNPSWHRLDVTASVIEAALVVVAERCRIHPVREWLRSLEWDGIQRLPELFVRFFGAHDTELTREIGKRWMISAVARVMAPGCQSKYMPVLESEQDAGKSMGIDVLVGGGHDGSSWYSDTQLRIGSGDKDAYQCLRAKWVHEWGELAAFKSAHDVEGLKSFVSSRTDNYRESYGRRNRDYPRQCVFIGTTNEERWLTDPTGGSRFWPVRCRKGVFVDRTAIAAHRDQLWAEAVVRFDAGERWWIDPASENGLLESVRVEQRERSEEDPWISLVRGWLEEPSVPDGDGSRTRVVVTEGVSATDVLLGACAVRRADVTRSMATRVGYVMRELGWARGPRMTHEDGSRTRVYLPPGE